MVRMLQKKEPLKIEMTLAVEFTEPDSAYNVLAEIPGSDLKDEIVMVGGHLDSWHGGTGATDDGTGVATAMEAVRIIKALGLKPRRTIRIGLWAGEEQGLLGSRGYVSRHLAERDESAARGAGGFVRGFEGRPDSASGVKLKPGYDKFCTYFNNDNGTGKIRGIYLQGNEALRPIFRAWLAPFRTMGAQTITVLNTGGTDHLSFTGVGLPGFQFIQDEIEYGTRTWHSTMDVYERALEADVQQAATIMAAFVYNAAMRDEKLPRR
jgi:Zn-dependent M28 family amino/carboxypeptidase